MQVSFHKSMLWHRQHALPHTFPAILSREHLQLHGRGWAEQCVLEPSQELLSMGCTPDSARKNQNLAAIWIIILYFAAKLPLIDQGSYRILSAFRAKFSRKNKTLFAPFFLFFFSFCHCTIWQFHPFEYYTTEQHKIAFPCCGTKMHLLKKEIAGDEMHAPVSKESMLMPNTGWGEEQ